MPKEKPKKPKKPTKLELKLKEIEATVNEKERTELAVKVAASLMKKKHALDLWKQYHDNEKNPPVAKAIYEACLKGIKTGITNRRETNFRKKIRDAGIATGVGVAALVCCLPALAIPLAGPYVATILGVSGIIMTPTAGVNLHLARKGRKKEIAALGEDVLKEISYEQGKINNPQPDVAVAQEHAVASEQTTGLTGTQKDGASSKSDSEHGRPGSSGSRTSKDLDNKTMTEKLSARKSSEGSIAK